MKKTELLLLLGISLAGAAAALLILSAIFGKGRGRFGKAAGGPLSFKKTAQGKKQQNLTVVRPLQQLAEKLSHSALFLKLQESETRSLEQKFCTRELPRLLDVVSLGLSAGLSFDASLGLYCARSHNGLSRLCGDAMLSWQMGACSREEGLKRMAEKTALVSMSRFAASVSESLRFGSPLAKTLEEQSVLIRNEERSFVEEEIERLPVKMLLPLGTLILPAMFLAILGPLLGSALFL